MKRLPTLVAGGLCAALLLAGGGRGEPRRDSPVGRGFGAERLSPLGYGAPAPRGFGFEGAAPGRYEPRGYDYGGSRGYAPPIPREEPYGRAPPAYYGRAPAYRAPRAPTRYGPPGYPPPPYRENSLGADWRPQQEEAREGVRQGQMEPLGRVIQGIGRRAAGRPLDAGIEYQDGRAVYRVRWMTTHGRRVDYIVDAASGAILSEH